MMPAISLTPLPPFPPFQFMPEPDLNFDVVLEAVPAPAPQVPSQPERVQPDETRLSFLGINPVKAQPIAPESAAIEDETLDDEGFIAETPFDREGGSPAFISTVSAIPPALPPSRENGGDLAGDPPTAAQTRIAVPLDGIPKAFGLSLSKPCLSFNLEEKDSTSTGSVRTEFGIPPSLSTILSPGGLVDAANPTTTHPSTPPADPLRFIVERQLDLARDSRWLDSLARDIIAVADTPDRLSFRLSPPQLGRLDVDLSTSDSGLSVRMNASTEAATQIIAAAQPRLIDELRNQGVRVAEAHVSTGGGQSQGQGQQQQRDAEQMIEFVRQRIERTNETNLTRPSGRFA